MKSVAIRAFAVSCLLVFSVALIGAPRAVAHCTESESLSQVRNIESLSTDLDHKRLVIYTSMRDAPMKVLTAAFQKTYPDIDVAFQSANGVKIMEKFEVERESGHVYADVLWTNEVTDFYRLKNEGMLMPYISPEAAQIDTHLKDFDGSFTPVRLAVTGIIYNTRLVKESPNKWSDLASRQLQGGVELPNPNMCSGARMAMSLLAEVFGEGYFAAVKANGTYMGTDCAQVVESTANGESLATLGLDDLAYDAMRRGAAVDIVYPPELPVLPSPVGIVAGSPNAPSAKLFVDFLLSEHGQQLIAELGMMPVRRGVAMPKELGRPTSADVQRRAIKAEYSAMGTSNERGFMRYLPAKRFH